MDSISVDFERVVTIGQAEARAMVVRVLRASEFSITTEQISVVTAKRGSQLAGSVQPKKLPVSLKATFSPCAAGTRVSIHIGDAWRSGVGKVWGMNGPYSSVLHDIQASLNAVLEPVAADDFAGANVATSTRDVPLLSQANKLTVNAGGAVSDKIDRLITPGDHRSTPKALTDVVLRSAKGTASFDRMAVEGLFSVGLMVSTRPGSMPANLAADVEKLTTRLETAVGAQPSGTVVCELTDEEIPVAEFLGKQAAIRSALPLRTLHVCTTCKFEKVVNPDYEKLREKNRRKQILTGAVGATVTSSGISPFLLVGSVLKFKNFDIPFVCPRCQGLDADSSIVTFCPNCGERRGEAVLRSCRRCAYDFGSVVRDRVQGFWGTEELPPAMATPQLGAPVPPTAPARAVLAAPVAGLAPPLVAASGAPLRQPAFAAPMLPAPVPSTPPGWYADTTGRHQHRYWDGHGWSDHVADKGVQSHDPLPR